jgi:uncharacterized protein
MAAKLDLPPAHAEIVRRVLAAHLPRVEVWVYGSRVDGSAHDGSDLDLVLRHPDAVPVEHRRLSALKDAFTESELPILVDLFDWARLPETFRQEIERTHVVMQKPGALLAAD